MSENKELRFKEGNWGCFKSEIIHNIFYPRRVVSVDENADGLVNRDYVLIERGFFPKKELANDVELVSMLEAKETILARMESRLNAKRNAMNDLFAGLVKETCTHQCDCLCHEPGSGVIHIWACCTPCEICGLFIKDEEMKEHLKECHDK